MRGVAWFQSNYYINCGKHFDGHQVFHDNVVKHKLDFFVCDFWNDAQFNQKLNVVRQEVLFR